MLKKSTSEVQPHNLLAILEFNGEPKVKASFTEFENEEHLAKAFFEVKDAEGQDVECSIGTETELVTKFELGNTTFRSGKTGWAGRQKSKYKGRTLNARANVVRQENGNDYGLTVGIVLPVTEQVTYPKAWGVQATLPLT